jgi:murein DD-endopeptidase MepM/ murein hydrolase activator NlpD
MWLSVRRHVRPRRVLLGLVAGALVAGLLAPATAGGQSSDPRTRRNELSEAIEGASAEEVAAIKELQAATARRQSLELRVADLDRSLSGAAQELDAAEAVVARINEEIVAVQAEIDRILAEIERLKSRFNEATAAMYKGSGNGGDSVLTLLATAAGEHEIVAGSKYLGEHSSRVERELKKQAGLKEQLAEARRNLDTEQAKAREAERVAAEKRDSLTQLRGVVNAEREQVIAAEVEENRIIEGIRARLAEFEAEYEAVQAQIQAEIAAAAASRGNPTPSSSGGGGGGGGGAPSGGGRLLWPIDGGRAGSGFGPRVHPISGGTRMHTGVDIGAASGTPIRAADDGVVVMAGWNGGYGNWTLIDHGGGLATGYGHQSSIGVSRGQRVSRGQVIGRVGSTGASTGPHLHWEVRVNGNPVNPMAWV